MSASSDIISSAFPYTQVAGIIFSSALVTVASIGLHDAVEKFPLLFRVIWVSAFLANCISVSVPGRFDGQNMENSWKTVFAPAGYAFAIWGVIYAGEALVSIYIGAVGRPHSVSQKASLFWAAGNLFQSLWCACFRPIFKSALWLPTSLLFVSGLSYFMLHNELTKSIAMSTSFWSKFGLYALRFPIALHTGWLAAATLLNFNGWAAVSKLALSSQVSIAFNSSYIAFIAGCVAAVRQQDPFLALTVAWALKAVAYQTKTDPQVKLQAETIQSLASTENSLANALIGAAVAIPIASKLF